MPATVKIRVAEARNLPKMDQRSGLSDPYVEVCFADRDVQRTETRRKTLNPQWNTDFRFEVNDDCVLQDYPVHLRVWDYDMVTTDNIIGSVYIDLNCFLFPDGPKEIAGWFPIYDSFRGVCGEMKVSVKLDHILDVNPFEDSSAGVKFFTIMAPPDDFVPLYPHFGFVEELVVDNDPEAALKDKIRSSRTSNESRQLLFYTLSGKLRRQLGRKVLALHCNTVLGYKQHFDLEGDNIVVRGYGTACMMLEKTDSLVVPRGAGLVRRGSVEGERVKTTKQNLEMMGMRGTPEMGIKIPEAETDLIQDVVHSATQSPEITDDIHQPADQVKVLQPLPITSQLSLHRSTFYRAQSCNRMQDVQLLTLTSFPKAVKMRIGGVVTARSVKLVSEGKRDQVQELRDMWWAELRDEVRAHARSLECGYVMGYTEVTSIHDEEVCVLSASGTAVKLNVRNMMVEEEPPVADVPHTRRRSRKSEKHTVACAPCHITYSAAHPPFHARMVQCLSCRGAKYVPEVLLATIEIPPQVPIESETRLVEARLCRTKRKAQGDTNALVVSEAIPFLEYDLHRQLLNKLRVHGMNAAFGLRTQITIGDSMIVGVATATAVYIRALPPPLPIQINRNMEIPESNHVLKQNHERFLKIMDLSKENHARRLKIAQPFSEPSSPKDPSSPKFGLLSSVSTHFDSDSDSESSDEDDEATGGEVEPAGGEGCKPMYVVEIDDETDEDTASILLDTMLPKGITLCSTEKLPSTMEQRKLMHLQRIMLIKRVQWNAPATRLNQHLCEIFDELYLSLIFRLQQYLPCCVHQITTDVAIPDEAQLQISIQAMVTLMADEPDLLAPIVDADDFHDSTKTTLDIQPPSPKIASKLGSKPQELVGEDSRTFMLRHRESFEDYSSGKVLLTPLSSPLSSTVNKYLGRVNMHFIRETTTLREEDGGVGSFMHRFLSEANEIASAYALGVGGTIVLGYRVTKFKVDVHGSQAYAIVSVSGDVATTTHLDAQV